MGLQGESEFSLWSVGFQQAALTARRGIAVGGQSRAVPPAHTGPFSANEARLGRLQAGRQRAASASSRVAAWGRTNSPLGRWSGRAKSPGRGIEGTRKSLVRFPIGHEGSVGRDGAAKRSFGCDGLDGRQARRRLGGAAAADSGGATGGGVLSRYAERLTKGVSPPQDVRDLRQPAHILYPPPTLILL